MITQLGHLACISSSWKANEESIRMSHAKYIPLEQADKNAIKQYLKCN